MRRGYIFLEILMGIALTGLVFVGAVAMFGDMRLKMQEHQLESAARKFISDCRAIQQYNMYVTAEDKVEEEKIIYQYKIVAPFNENYYTIDINDSSKEHKKYYFADVGCDKVYFGGQGTKEVLFSALGSVNDSAYIVLKHRDNEELKLTLNLQPVTGRIEIEK